MENQKDETWFLGQNDVKFLLDEFNKNVSRFQNLSDIAEGDYENKRGSTPYEVIYQKNRFRILHYLSDHPKRFKTPLLIVYALINRYYILDLTADKSFVRYLMEKGFDVYMVDWGTPSKVEGKNTIGDYVTRYLDRGIDKLLEFTGENQVNLCGYCLGAMLSLIYTSAFQQKIKNLVLLTPPVDFSDDGVLTAMTRPKYFNVEKIVRHFDHLIPSEFIQSGFDFKNMLGNLFSAKSFWDILWNKKALEGFFPMNYWVHDNVPISSEFWKEYITKFYVQNSFMTNNFYMNGRKLDFKNITCPLLSVAADNDDIVTEKCAKGSMEIVGSKDKSFLLKRGGHIGVMTGSMAKNEVWPDIFSWLSDRSERIVLKDGDRVHIK
ncbi:MAG TPA: hypothetical protein DHW82_01605 [Spirochaetia bacterium]|nr:MAG: hypothetical protein A2Y41_00920 [Spirochaetes bacterium GWB1_36_13]HCL55691.1 hypothetical protein [Spirochaetia bacterium]